MFSFGGGILNKSEDGSRPEQCTSAVTEGPRISPPGNLTKGNDLQEDWRDEPDKYWKGTICQRAVQGRQMILLSNSHADSNTKMN